MKGRRALHARYDSADQGLPTPTKVRNSGQLFSEDGKSTQKGRQNIMLQAANDFAQEFEHDHDPTVALSL